uniref:Uncharacterized protein n=1 Tax=Arundo donax TaxID=35708 RepID=A0A0A9EZU4_ARUDO
MNCSQPLFRRSLMMPYHLLERLSERCRLYMSIDFHQLQGRLL